MGIPRTHSRIVLAERPGPGNPINDKTFRFERDVATPNDIEEDRLLVRTEMLSLDPAMRGWLDDIRSYVPPVKLDEVMRAGGIARVLKVGSKVSGFKEGDTVYCDPGWAELAVVKSKNARVIKPPPGAQPSDYLANLGMPGQTAYWGLLDVGQLKEGEKVLVTGAAGAVGSLVCQIAKVKGCQVLATCGSDDKCRWLKEELGVDVALNYKSPTFVKDFRAFKFLDVMFDSTSDSTELTNDRRRRRAAARSRSRSPEPRREDRHLRSYLLVQLCRQAYIQALCAQSVDAIDAHRHGAHLATSKDGRRVCRLFPSLTRAGFVVFDYAKRYGEAERDIAKWIGEGKIKRRETRLQGLESCVEGLKGLFEGANTGKLIVEIGTPSAKL